jgi:serine protease Do
MNVLSNRRLVAATVLSGVIALGAACSSIETPEGDNPGNPTVGSDATAIESTPAPASQPTTDASARSAFATTEELVQYAGAAVVRVAIPTGVGSGFVIDGDGYIITNFHVVENGLNNVTVTLADGARLRADVVGVDPRADLAVLKVSTSDELESLELADLDDVGVGQDVVAIGFALDLTGGSGPPSVTRGIVSAKNRPIASSGILGAIQTDTAINHGNSGGPLVNYDGKVVGVNTSLAPDRTSTTGIAQNIGFAVGADTIGAVYDEIREKGEVLRAFLGIGNFAAIRAARREFS